MRKFAFLCMLCLFGTISCKPREIVIQERLLKQKNQVSFIFQAPITTVKAAISNAFDLTWRIKQGVHRGAFLFWKDDGNEPMTRGVFSKPGNENDAFLSSVGMGLSVGKSSVYFKNNQPLEYVADFQIHLRKMSNDKTQIEIFTFDSQIIAGTESGIHGPASIFVTVAPTTIEEYAILERIGEMLKVDGMPEIIMPDDKEPFKTIVLQRSKERL